MTPIHIHVVKAGKDGLTVVDSRGGEPFRVEAGAMEGNGWLVPDSPGGAGQHPVLHVDGERVVLRDLELGVDYWMSSTGLILAGCARVKHP